MGDVSIGPNDVLQQLARAAGFRVYVWDAVENGDEADSYFWMASGAGDGMRQSELTFPSDRDAWLDCCEANGLLAPIAQELGALGYGVFRQPGFIAYRWAYQDGMVSNVSFPSAAEALIACAMYAAEQEEPAEVEGAQCMR